MASMPVNVSIRRRRLDLFWSLGRFREAEADTRFLVEAGVPSVKLYHQAALLRLLIGDDPGYRRLIGSLLVRIKATPSRTIAWQGSWISALGPPEPRDLDELIKIARFGAGDPKPPREALLALGDLLYRADRLDEAIAVIGPGSPWTMASPPPGIMPSWRWPRPGRAGWRRRVRHLDALAAWQPSDDPSMTFENLEFLILRREAEAVVRFDPGFPADPLAR